jgi:hypothetical protein
MRTFLQIRRAVEDAAAKLNARWGKPVQQVLRWGIPILLLAILGYALTQLGWAKVYAARPASPLFYIVALVPFFVQPIADLIIYRNLLGSGRALPLVVFLRKRYMNSIMLDYSGEVYLFFWAKKNLELKQGVLLHAVKDTNVLSASAGLVMVWLMLLVLVAGGFMKMPAIVQGSMWTVIFVGSLPLVLGLALFVGGRKVTALSRIDIATTFAIHLVRCVLTLAFEFWIWWLSGALPTIALCLQFVALRLLLTRLPLVPSKELVFIGVGIAAAGYMDVSAPQVAAVLVLMTAAGLIEDLLLVGLPWFLEQFRARHAAGQTVS